MILLRKLYCVGCHKNTLHIIHCQQVKYVVYLTAICLELDCDNKRHMVVGKDAFLELCLRTRDDKPTSEGGI